jgi:polyisoprenyl-teichoic acid--peptidoglycan teichoic acid transferase
VRDRSPASRTVYRRPAPETGSAGAPLHRQSTSARKYLTARRWPRRTLITANIFVALCLLGAGGAYGYAVWRVGQIHKEKLTHLATSTSGGGGGAPFTVLIVGSDSRSALSGPDNAQFGGSSAVGGQRSDTTIVARIVPKYHEIMMMSIPRDLWVNIPGMGPNRINAAFDNGPDLLVETIEQDLHIPINHYVEVNFDTFRDITNAVGGVKFYFPTPAKDAYSLLNIPAAGCYNLSGDQALAFVRARHYEYYANGQWNYEAESDLARIQRQQTFIKKMIVKAESKFDNPIALNDVIGGVVKNLTVDTRFSTGLLLTLAKDFHSMNAATIPSLTLPNYAYTTAGGASVLGLQQPQAAQTIAAFNAYGTTPPPKPAKKKAPPKPAPTTTTTRVTAPPVTVKASSLSVEVANGTGLGGQAGRMSQTLAALGYNTTISTNSPGQTYATTTIEYAPDALTAGEQLRAEIPGGAVLVKAPSLTPTTFNVEVITGATFTAATGGASGSTTSASSSTTSSTIPGTNAAQYELPGSTGPPPANC